jgi:hypothetical protein
MRIFRIRDDEIGFGFVIAELYYFIAESWMTSGYVRYVHDKVVCVTGKRSLSWRG